MRVVSLLPSATEILCLLGAEGLLVGRSHECDWPATVTRLPVVTRPTSAIDPHASPQQIDAAVRTELAATRPLYQVDEALLASLRPDVIITQDLCAVCSIDLPAVQRLAARLSPAPAVISLNPTTFEGVLDDIMTVAGAIGRDRAAVEAITNLRARVYAAQEFVNAYSTSRTVALLEWTDPLFVGGHWTPQLIERAGAWHPLNPTVPIKGAGAAEGPIGMTQRAAGKSIAIPAPVFAASNPDAIIIAPCGRTLAQATDDAADVAKQPWWANLAAVRAGRVAIVDGNQYFNRPGPRLVDALEFLIGWLHDRPE
ncbi:MAG: ABC transporter substrate-binding protein, partial [Phycisphaerales bacterium]|nr:ABC transporter substrate-binding protein [Phycisphaerales bacterium]